MSYFKTRGIITNEVTVSEADKIVTIFTRNHGKISAFVKNAKKANNPHTASTQFLCYSDFVLFKNKDIYLINSSEVIEPFYEIRNDIERLTFAAHLADLVNDVVQEDQPFVRLLQLFLISLHLLASSKKPAEFIASVFELKLLALSGYSPLIDCCTICGESSCNSWFFGILDSGLVCKNCAATSKDYVKISVGSLKALSYIIKSDVRNVFNFEVSQDVFDELQKISQEYLRKTLEKDYSKLSLLKALRRP